MHFVSTRSRVHPPGMRRLPILPILMTASVCTWGQPRPPEPLAIDVSGCRAVRSGPVCELESSRELRVVVQGAAIARFETEQGALGAVAAPVDRGTRHAIRVPDGARVVRVSTPGRSAVFEVDQQAPPTWWTLASASRRGGSRDEAARIAREHLGGRDGALARGLLARIALAEEDHGAAIEGLRASSAQLRAQGRISDAADDSLALAFALSERAHDYAAARAVLSELAPLLDDLPDARAALPYYASRVARGTGDVRGALALVAEAEARAERLGLVIELREAKAARAMANHDLGRYDASCRIYGELLDAPFDDYPCAFTRRSVNLAIAATAAIESGIAAPACPDPVAALERALTTECREPSAVANAWIVLAHAHVLARRFDAAAIALARSLSLSPDPLPELAMGAALVDAEIAMSNGEMDHAIRSFRDAEEASALAGHAADAIGAVLGGARARAARGDLEGALREWERADAWLDEATLHVPLGDGRASFASSLQRASAARLHVLLDLGRYPDALRVIAAAHGRTVRDLSAPAAVERLRGDARSRWDAAAGRYAARRAQLERETARAWTMAETDRRTKLVELRSEHRHARAELERLLEELAPHARREPALDPTTLEGDALLLAYEPLDQGFAAVAASPRAVVGARVDGDALLAPFDAAIAAARRIRVLAPPSLAHVDFHALSFRGRPLAAHGIVEYVIASALPRSGERRRGALVVGDPSGDLPGARAEAGWVRDALAARGNDVTYLSQADATSARLLAALGAADVLHFSGHALHERDHAWGAALSLHRTDRLEIADVLAAPRVPPVVILAACNGAKQEGDALGIAHAFVLAGSRAVVAPSRAVSDALSLAFARRFHGVWDGRPESASEAVREAQLATMPEGDWAAFRIFVP